MGIEKKIAESPIHLYLSYRETSKERVIRAYEYIYDNLGLKDVLVEGNEKVSAPHFNQVEIRGI